MADQILLFNGIQSVIFCGMRFSLDNLKPDDDVLNIPLFIADQTDRQIGLALEQRQADTHHALPAGFISKTGERK